MKNKYKCAVFDLDGTLVDTVRDLGNACDYVIRKHNFNAKWNDDDYRLFTGNGMKKLVDRAFKEELDEDTLNVYLGEFKEYYDKHYLDNTKAYNGITEQLQILKEKGITLCVVTNKAEDSAKFILEHIFDKGMFDVIIGQREGLAVKPDPAGILLALNEANCKKEDAIFFGDSEVDMQTALNAGIDVVGVLWGFRDFETISPFNPMAIIEKSEDISKLF